ncbi:MAG: TetR/AcrR family transcriptional regulator [Candidatus Zixiibacteriota bacterium]|nr:MAG: TetR/AcrR family transcriptional regulator [candidate division Zixibacteria bacterium]
MARVSKKPEERKEELIEAARRLFIAKGYEHTAVSDIVRETNVAQGTFYYHFRSKLDVLEEVAKKWIFSLAEEVAVMVDSPADPLAKLNSFYEVMIRYSYSRQPLTSVLHQESNLVLHHKLSQITMSKLVPLLERVLDEGRRQGVFSVDYPAETARLLLLSVGSMFHDRQVLTSAETIEKARRTLELSAARILGVADGEIRLNFDITSQ